MKIIISNNKSIISPGNQKKHYAPNLPIRINVKKINKNESLLNFGNNNLKSNICEYNLSFSGNLNSLTDESSLFDILNEEVFLYKGSSQNIKITLKEDLQLAEFIIRNHKE